MASITCVSFLSSICGALFFAKRNMSILPGEMAELRRMRDGTVRMVETEEMGGVLRRTNEVKVWEERVDALDTSTQELFAAFHGSNRPTLGYLRLLWELGSMLQDTRELKSQWARLTLLTQLPDPVVQAVSAVHSHLRDGNSGSGIIGICGAGGMGKTTLLEIIREQAGDPISGDPRWDEVVSATVSSHDSIRSLQVDLGTSLHVFSSADEPGSPSDTVENYARKLRRALQGKRFLLLLDDVQEKLDLASIGIPVPLDCGKKSKILFTTGSLDVCRDMGVQATVELNPLDEAHSWELFRCQVAADHAVLDDPSIQPLAKAVAARCGGVPLALVAVGRAMSGKRTAVDWEDALRALQDPSLLILEGEKYSILLPALVLSYRYLRDDQLRSCLVYCCMFPEGCGIDKEQLIRYWVGEGLLDVDNDRCNVSVTRERCHEIIRSLQAAGLLQKHGSGRSVKLHRAVRDMALWMTSGESDPETKFLVVAGKGFVHRVPSAAPWEGCTRLSLMHSKIDSLPEDIPKCSRLETLLISNTNPTQNMPDPKLKECQIVELGAGNPSTFLPTSFFLSFPALRVLDFSHSPVDYLPHTIGLLRKLQYLNLSHTSIRSLPRELGDLTKLRQLDLRHMEQLSVIPLEAMSRLTALQLLNLYDSRYLEYRTDNDLKLLECLEDLEELGISLGDLRHFGVVVRSERLHRSVAFLKVFQMNGLISANLSAAFDVWAGLRELWLEECHQLEEFRVDTNQLLHLRVLQFRHVPHLARITLGDPQIGGAHGSPPLPRLSYLFITHCPRLMELRFVGDLPLLEEIHVHNCNAMTQLLTVGVSGGGENGNNVSTVFLPILRELHLGHLGSLKHISSNTSVQFPSLKTLKVEGCPLLELLPRGSYKLISFSDQSEGVEVGQPLSNAC